MATDLECALMAGHAYLSTTALANRLPPPAGWTPFGHQMQSSGLEVVSFQRGSEIVISIAGTYPTSIADWWANSGLATDLGWGRDQLRQAALYYCQVRAANPGANISFTGHSLGGGLASLLSVFFDRPAVTFDEAPFRNSADTDVRDDIREYLVEPGIPLSARQELETYTDGAREGNVRDYYVQGEVLSIAPVSAAPKIGSPGMLSHGTPDLKLAIDLHSQTLMTAFLQNDDKLAAYPFQKYGMLSGRVIHISADASENDNSAGRRSSVNSVDNSAPAGVAAYKACIRLDSQSLSGPRGTALAIAPGMQVAAEINQGKRSVLEYLLSPVQKAVHEAGRER